MNKKKTIILLVCLVILIIALILVVNQKKVQISFDTLGGSTVETIAIKKNSKIEKPQDPQKDGYIFDGWTLDGKEFDFNEKITKNIKLVANWLKNTNEPEIFYQISFDSNGGDNVEDFKVADGKITKLPVPERDGYKFLGWFDGENEIKVGDTISKNINLTAKWEKIENETKPTESTKPTTPTKSTTPTKPETPAIPEEPTTPSKPETPATPEEPVKPDTPTVPVTPDNPEKPDTPEEPDEPKDTITYKVEEVPGSIVGQVKIFILTNGVKTAGYADITTNKGKKVTQIPASGLDINKDKIVKIENPRLSN